MSLNTEENYKFQKMSLTVLAKLLDDICPKFETEPPELRQQLISERVSQFKTLEKDLDSEWKELEKEALIETRKLKKASEAIKQKLEKTRKTKRIASKVRDLKHKKRTRIAYLKKKLSIEVAKLQKRLKLLNPTSKKFSQITRKLNSFQNAIESKIQKSQERYDVIINNTLNSNNSELVDARIQESERVWQRRFVKLEKQFDEKVSIFLNKAHESDQIRIALQTFVEDPDKIKHWCLQAGISMKSCYQEAKERLQLLGRNSPELNDLLKKLEEQGDL